MEAQFYNLWLQIGTKLCCKSSLLAFEPLNEPTGSTPAQFAELKKLNTIFLQALKDSGGFNTQRVVTLVGPGEDSVKTSLNLERPSANFTNPWAIQFHYYSPYDFIFSAWGKTIWGSDADIAAMDADFAAIRGNFTDVPILIGEWESNNVDETAARWKYFNTLQVLARKYSFGTFLWDNSATELDRSTETWRDQTAINTLLAAAAGKPNALPYSTTDPSSTTQRSDAFIYHQYGTPVTDATLTYDLNGNTLLALAGPYDATLNRNTDYNVTGSNITYRAGLLSKFISPTSTPGSLANFTLKFDQGASLTANLSSNSSSAGAVNAAGGDLAIPVTWKGINRPAAVKAVLPDGTCLFDTWTVYLPAPQQCRMVRFSRAFAIERCLY
jgi:endoglucanase